MERIATFAVGDKNFSIYKNGTKFEMDMSKWDSSDFGEIEDTICMSVDYDQLKKFVHEICGLKGYFERMENRL